MIPFNLNEIALILNAKHIGMNDIIYNISINSNFIGKQCMFIALQGNQFDGHNFVNQAVSAGARALLVNRYILLNIPQLVVFDTHIALMQLSNWVRQNVPTKVLAITGSSGKTSVKEMTAAILRGCGRVVATDANDNNTIGVPTTLLRLTKKSNYAVIEIGGSQIGEIDRLSQIVNSDVALINNIFPSHLLGFKSLTTIGQEKGKIFSSVSVHGIGIVNADSHTLYLWYNFLKGKNVWQFALQKREGIGFYASNIFMHIRGMRFILHTPYGSIAVILSMLGLHNIANALAASALSCSIGISLSKIAFGLKNIKTIPGRLHPIILSHGKLLLDDTYNSNIGSMIAAIQVLNSMPGYRVLVVSDMLELGLCEEVKYHNYIGELIARTDIHQILTIGEVSCFIAKKSGKKNMHFCNKDKLINYLKKMISQYTKISILIKGSRSFKMESVVVSIKDSVRC